MLNLNAVKDERLKLEPVYLQYSRTVARMKSTEGHWSSRYVQRPKAIEDYERRLKSAKRGVTEVQAELRELSLVSSTKEIRKQRFAELFVQLAKQALDTETFDMLKRETLRRLDLASAAVKT